MIAIFISIFIAVLIGVSLIAPMAQQVNVASSSTNSTGSACTYTVDGTSTTYCSLYLSSSWGATVLKMVPGFFALIILGVVIAGLYSVFRQAGIV